MTLDEFITTSGKHPGFIVDWDGAINRQELEKNAKETISKTQEFFKNLGIPYPERTSCWRTRDYNRVIGGALSSKHVLAQAIDFLDEDKTIGRLILRNVELLQKSGLFMESLVGAASIGKFGTHNTPNKTPWVHLAISGPASGHIIFVP